MASKAQKWVVTVVYDPETGGVVTNGPASHPDVMLKMLAAAMSQVGDVVAELRQAAEQQQAGKPDIVVPSLAISQKLGLKS